MFHSVTLHYDIRCLKSYMYVIMYEFVAYLRVVGELWDDLLPGLQPPCLKVYIVAVEIRPTWNLGGEEERERERSTRIEG